jgi:hypothetical protein
VREFGGQVWVSSEGDYEITDRENPQEPLPGVYFNLATPLSMLPQEVDSMLLTLTRTGRIRCTGLASPLKVGWMNSVIGRLLTAMVCKLLPGVV